MIYATDKTASALPAALLGLSILFGGCSSITPLTTPAAKSMESTTSAAYTDANVIIKQADSYLEDRDFQRAREGYMRFLALHPTHSMAPYVQYKIAQSYRKQAVSVHHDTEPTEKALEALIVLVKKYPGSTYETTARKDIGECRNWLAEAGLIRGEFYYNKEAYLAAAHRFETVLQTFPDAPAAAEAKHYLDLIDARMQSVAPAPVAPSEQAGSHPGQAFAPPFSP